MGASVSRREFLVSSAAAVGIAALGASCATGGRSSSARRERPPNVLYVTADDLGTTLNVYGHSQVVSPNIDAFATRSVLFERCHCQIAICSASRTSVLTGVRPETSGAIALEHDWRALLPDATSLPRLFRDHGYRTASVGKIFDWRGGATDDCWDEERRPNGVADASEALPLLDQLARGGDPFFLAVGFTHPHCPWTPTERSMAGYDVDSIELLGPGRTFTGEMARCSGASAATVDDAEARAITARFFGEITDMDRAFGQILAAVDRLDLADDTIIIFWSGDHGFHLGHNDRWGKWTCHDAATRVPLLMSVPGMTTAGRRARGIVECVDMYPTLVELCGLPAPPQELGGLSFVPLLDDPSRSWKHGATSVFGLVDVGQRSITTERYNYIEVLPRRLRKATFELYDLVDDPGETRNLHAELPHVAEVLAGHLALGPASLLPDAPPITF